MPGTAFIVAARIRLSDLSGQVIRKCSMARDFASLARLPARQQMAGETLRRDAVRLVLAGRTSVAEAMRISNQFEE